MAADLKHPERVVGFHFFNPVAVMPLLEIIRGEATDDATLATAFATGKKLKKTAILAKDSPSFIANRLLGRFMGEVGRIVDEGHPAGRRRPRVRRSRPDAAVRPAGSGRSGDRAAQQRDPAGRLPAAVPRVGEPAPPGRRRQAGVLHLPGWQAVPRPRGRSSAWRRRPTRWSSTPAQVREQVLSALAQEAR